MINVSTLQQSLRGQVIQPGDPDYDAVRALYNGMIDKRPRVHRALRRRGRRDDGRELWP